MRQWRSIVFLAVVAVAGGTPAGAQVDTGAAAGCGDGRDAIRLLAGDICPSTGRSNDEASRLRSWLASGGAAGQETVHLLVQLDRVPDPTERAGLERLGLVFGDYLPHRTWMVTAPVGQVESVLALPGAVFVKRWEPADKLHPRVQRGDWGPWARHPDLDGTVMVFVQLHTEVELDELETLAERHGGTAIEPLEALRGATVWIPESRLADLAAEEAVRWVEEGPAPLSPTNAGVRANMNVDPLHGVPYDLSGDGVRLFVFDGGRVRSSHVTFDPGDGSRVTSLDSSAVADHPTHVAGTAAGDGSGSTGGNGRGVAEGATLLTAGYEQSLGTMLFWDNAGDIQADYATARGSYGADLGTNSIGSNTASNGYPCDREGDYGVSSELVDGIVRGDNGTVGSAVIMTWANGNERGGGTSYPGGCGAAYLTTAPPSCAKNPIHVGAINSDGDSMTSFSSWGPCDDGRLKPVVSAPGCELGRLSGETSIYSSLATNNTTYGNMCGTSMATPAVAGTVALMLEEWRGQGHGGANDRPLPALVKTLLVQTARDLGQDGPDFIYGYGAVDARGAVDLVIAGNGDLTAASTDWGTGAVGDGETDSYTMIVPTGSDELRVSLAWDDRSSPAYSGGPLQNDLDLWLEAPDATVHRPWVLDPTAGSRHLPATRGVNTLDNQEQVVVEHPQAGVWTLRVAGTEVPHAPQSYGLAYEARADVHGPGTCAEQLGNGGFETDTGGWTVSGASRQAAPTTGHGSFSLRFGGAASTTHTAYTSVAIPADATRAELSYWWHMTTQEGAYGYGWDDFYVEIRSSAGALLVTRDARSDGWPAGQWMQQRNIDLSAYAGQTVRVYFEAANDNTLATTFWIDDLSVETCTAFACEAPSGLGDATAIDLDGCADGGVQVSWDQDPASWGDGGTGTRTFDVLRDGSTIAAGLSAATTSYTDTTGADGVGYSYAVRYSNGCGLSATTDGVAASDQVAPTTPAAPLLGDPDACDASGVTVAWSAIDGATAYDLRIDAVTVVAGVASPYAHDPGDTADHSYEVRARTASCTGSWSPVTTFADGDGTPTAPPAPRAFDPRGCVMDGLLVSWDPIAGATSVELRIDGATVVTGASSPYTHVPGDDGVHTFEVRGTNAACGGAWSAPVSAFDGTPTDQILLCDGFETGSTGGWTSATP